MENYKVISISIVAASFLLFSSPAQAVVGETVVANSGEPVPTATLTFETTDGEPLATAQTDGKGAATVDLPEQDVDREIVVTVEDKDGKTTRQTFTQPAGEPWYRVALDTAGGIIVLTRQFFDILKGAAKPIIVGDNAEVGSGARLKEKAADVVGGALSGVMGGLFGGGGSKKSGSLFSSGSGGSLFSSGGKGGKGGKDIETEDDPIDNENKRIFTDPATGTKIAVGAKMTPNGLLVSTNILESDDGGTFQTIYLMDSKGRRAGPTRYDVYELYQDWKLTVTWTYDRWVDGKHVEHKEGGWSEGGRNILGTFTVPQGKDGIWSKMGFSSAAQGIKGLGTFFPISSEQLQNETMSLVVHVSRPSQDTVTTTPFVLSMSQGDWSGGNASFVNPM